MTLYFTLKVIHLAAMVAWFAGLFYLPRLFVYQLEHPKAADTLIIMQRKLAVIIMRPAAAVTILAGLGLILTQPYIMQQGWLHAKLGLVMLLISYHFSLEYFRRQLATSKAKRSSRFFRMYNEVPTILLLGILSLAVAKPF